MAVQSPPFALQNASHPASLFRQAGSSPFSNLGVMAPGDYAITAQSTPNMSVQAAAGRAWIPGSQVANVTGGTFSTQAAYFGINDAPATLTISAASATNPRIDTVYVAVQDAFYSGTNNLTVLGVVTGTPAASPVAPAAPSNAIVLATVAVAANATSITNANIAQQPVTTLLANALGGIDPAAANSATAGTYVDQYRGDATKGLQRWNGSAWGNPTPVAHGGTSGVLVGSAPATGTQLITKTILVAANTNGSGDQSVTFPGGSFPNGVLSIQVAAVGNGNNPASAPGGFFWQPWAPSLSGCTIRLFAANSTVGVGPGGLMNAIITVVGW